MDQHPLDPDSLRYAQHWEPVLAAAGLRALDRIGSAPQTLLDLGAGTGSLTLAAAERWPRARVIALDASGAMLAVARDRVAERGFESSRFEWLACDATHIPRAEGSLDVVVSSFVLQLVDDRPLVLAEVGRVLRPGGCLSFVTWLADELVLPADAVYHEVIGDIDDEDGDEASDAGSLGSGEYDSPEQVRDELARAGFEAIEVAPEELRYAWSAESYLAFKLGYDDRDRLETLEASERSRLEAALRERLATLPAEAFEVRASVVAALARKPGL